MHTPANLLHRGSAGSHFECHYNEQSIIGCISGWDIEGRRPRGCPKKTWDTTIKEDCSQLRLNCEDAKNRDVWRGKINVLPRDRDRGLKRRWWWNILDIINLQPDFKAVYLLQQCCLSNTCNHHHLFRPLSQSRGRTFAILLLQTALFLASSQFSRSWLQSSLMVASQVFFGRPRGLLPSISHPLQALFTQSDSSFLTTCPYHLSLFLLMHSVTSSNPVISLSLSVECRSRKLFPP